MAKKPAFLKEGSAAEEKTESKAFEKREDAGKGKGKAKGFKPFAKKGKK